MAEKKVSKAIKRFRKEREKRREENKSDKIWDALKGVNSRENIKIFSPEEKARHFARPKAIGTTTCPVCGKSGVFVSNVGNVGGSPDNDIVMRHNNKKSVQCEASLKPLKNVGIKE